MGNELEQARIAFLVNFEGTERVELTEPRRAVAEAGADAHLVSTHEQVQTFNHLDKAEVMTADRTVDQVSADDYDPRRLLRHDRRAVRPGGGAHVAGGRTAGTASPFEPAGAVTSSPPRRRRPVTVSGHRRFRGNGA